MSIVQLGSLQQLLSAYGEAIGGEGVSVREHLAARPGRKDRHVQGELYIEVKVDSNMLEHVKYSADVSGSATPWRRRVNADIVRSPLTGLSHAAGEMLSVTAPVAQGDSDGSFADGTSLYSAAKMSHVTAEYTSRQLPCDSLAESRWQQIRSTT